MAVSERCASARLDIAVGYAATALFGMAMVILGSRIPAEGKGIMLVVNLAECLRQQTGPVGRMLFLLGAWGAVFSSLLGVWQSVPYIFADFCGMGDGKGSAAPVSTVSRSYRLYLYAIATVPLLGLLVKFARIQLLYAFVGACFMPLLAVVLLFLNGNAALVGRENRNRMATVVVLLATLAFFAVVGWLEVAK